VCRRHDAFVPAVMEHIEYAGVHSGDSACVIPPVGISDEHIALIEEYTRRIAVELGVVGLMNIQYAISNGTVYVLEANPRASRTVPLVSKVCDVQMARIATQVMLGETEADLGLRSVSAALRRQGGGLPVQHVPRGRPAARARDALDR
jgi:carbamoyl-phosphate synthase large subunit